MKSYPWCSCHHSVGEDEQIQAYQLENVLKEPNDLQSEHILETEKCRNSLKVSSELLKHPGKSVQGAYLSTVISHFKDGSLPANPA